MKVLDAIVLSSPSQRAMRAVEVAAPVLFMAMIPVSGGVFHLGFTVVGLLLTLVVALVPQTHAPLGLVLYLAGLWMVSSSGRLDLWTPVAAALLFALHLACMLSSYGPPGLRLDAGLLAVWRRRAVLCLEAAVLVWVVAAVLSLFPLSPSTVGVGLGLLVVIGWVALLTVRLARPDAD
jgi:hypothetical protein